MIDRLNIAKTDMTWHGIDLHEGDLYGHETWHGVIYCHVPVANGNFIHFTDIDGANYSCKLYDLPSNIHYYYVGDDVYFEEALDLTEQTVQRLFDEAMDKRQPIGGYEVHFTDAYGYECGCISGRVSTYQSAVDFIVAQSEDPIYMDKWNYRDGNDHYEIKEVK